ncbi:MAG: hypothetical protein EGP80_01340 [Blautia wexlerae]|nr:hypothetical protein [Blautia wexlerae]
MQSKIALTDVIDMHVHTAPDICQRTYNALEQEPSLLGDLNKKSVQDTLEIGARIIWLSTVDAENDYRKHVKSGIHFPFSDFEIVLFANSQMEISLQNKK